MRHMKIYGSVVALVFFITILSNCDGFSDTSRGFSRHNRRGPKSKVENEIILKNATISFDQQASVHDVFKEYRIAPGDVLAISFQARIWEEKKDFYIAINHTISVKFVHAPELNETQQIRPDGKISLAYLGEVYVVGKTVSELMNELKERYKGILSDPELYVTVPDFRSGITQLRNDLHTSGRGLSRLVAIRPDGYATFPILGSVSVANKTVPELNQELNTQYARYLPSVQVDLSVESISGSSIYVIGMVANPGTYTMNKPITVLEALSLAGGYVRGAKLNSVFIIRKKNEHIIAKRINVSKILALRRGSEFFYLQPNDMVYIPKTFISKAAEFAKDLQTITFFRGVGISFSYDLNNNSNSTRIIEQ